MFNLQALMEHGSRQFHTIVRRYSSASVLLDQVCERAELDSINGDSWNDTAYLSPAMLKQLLMPSDTGYPKVSAGSDFVAYVTTVYDDSVFLTGPVLLPEEKGYLHTFPECCYDSQWLRSLYSCDLIELITETLPLYNLFHEQTFTAIEVAALNTLSDKDEFTVQKKFHDIIFQNQEANTHHNPYDQEIREFSSIRNGDLKQLAQSMDEDYPGTVGTLARTQLRSFQNLAIVIITLASRAAIEGGVMPEIAYTLSDSYIQKVETLHIPEAAIQLARKAEYQYASMVHNIKNSKESVMAGAECDPRITQCKDYIFSHLHGKLSTANIANALHINPNYLSNLFKKEEGITITEYILKEKIKLVKNMLIYSHYSYSTIAAYLGFSSQSHLGKQFKQITGMTLHNYRETYGKKDFDF